MDHSRRRKANAAMIRKARNGATGPLASVATPVKK
jgi:hypothetical protein